MSKYFFYIDLNLLEIRNIHFHFFFDDNSQDYWSSYFAKLFSQHSLNKKVKRRQDDIIIIKNRDNTSFSIYRYLPPARPCVNSGHIFNFMCIKRFFLKINNNICVFIRCRDQLKATILLNMYFFFFEVTTLKKIDRRIVLRISCIIWIPDCQKYNIQTCK